MTAPHPLLRHLAAERRGRGLRQKDVAVLAGICCRSISHWESGVRQPTLDGLDLYVRALGFRLIVDRVVEAEDDPGEQIPFGEIVVGDGEKWCRGCHQVRTVRHFHRDRSRKDGLHHRCKHCRRDLQDRRRREAAARDVKRSGEPLSDEHEEEVA